VRRFVSPLFALLLAGGCASASGKSSERPDLVIPPPPAHVVPITPEPVIEPVAEVPAPPSASAPAGRGAARGAHDVPPRSPATETRPETKADTRPADTAAPPETAPPPSPPAPQLHTAEASGAEAAVRAAIDRTRNLLNTIDYRRLSNDRKKAYDDAKGFAQQAEEALKAGNVVFAQGVAGKAEALAKELAGK